MSAGAKKRAVLLLSGGLDSATTLAIMTARGRECYTLSVDYDQQHRIELDAARRIANAFSVADHRVVKIDYGQLGGSALTDTEIPVPTVPTDGIPATYVPARNTVMLAIGLGWCEVLDASELYIGVNAVDYSGYPDCRPAFIEQFEQLAAVATRSGTEGHGVAICAPLIAMSKSEIIKKGLELGVDYGLTVSCYQPDKNADACGFCDACRLRLDGFVAAGVKDPTHYVQPASREGYD